MLAPQDKPALDRAIALLSGPGWETVHVQEGQEPAGFWDALGAKRDYKDAAFYAQYPQPAKLFCCSTKSGGFVAEEVPEYTQAHLTSDDVLFLVRSAVYVDVTPRFSGRPHSSFPIYIGHWP